MQEKYEFDEQPETTTRPAPVRHWPETLVRTIGIVLLLIGLWAGLHVILESLSLYRDPLRIEQLAQAIERGSRIDQSLSAKNHVPDSALRNPSERGLQLSYFVAWVVALMLLLLISMMAFSCIRAGSDLVLQDKNLKRYLTLNAKQALLRARPG